MKKLLTLFLIAAAAISATAQSFNVTGKVLDAETKEGEIGAILQFFTTGTEKPIAFTSASDDGSFAIKLKGGKEYRILASNLGRKSVEKTFKIEKADVDLGEILMENDANQLAAASVTAQKTLVKMEVDKMTYNVSEDVDSKSSTVLDMLRKVPMVTVDAQDNITVNGSSNFLVTVDGKPNQMLTKNASMVFKMMPAAAVKNIEVITNPGVKYDAEGVGGVLNLVTEAGSNGGGSGSSVTEGTYGTLSLNAGNKQSTLGAMVTAQKGKVSFSADVNVGYSYGYKNSLDIINKYGTTTETTTGKNNQKGKYGLASIQLSYEPDSLNLLSFNADGYSIWQNVKNNTAIDIAMGGASVDSYKNNSKTKTTIGSWDLGFDWQHRFANAPGRTLTMSYRGSLNPNKTKNDNIFTPETVLRPSRKIDGDTDSEDHTFQADFTTKLGKTAGSLSTGVKFIYRNNSSAQDLFLRSSGTGAFVIDEASSIDYHYTNKIGAAYAEYSNTLGKFGIKLGGRYEHTWQDITYKKGNGNDYSTKYGTFVPTASIQYNIAPTRNIGISYNVRISRPGITYLNPFVDVSNPTHYTYGNPDLDVAKSHNFSLVYNFYSPFLMVSSTLSHSLAHSGISEYTFTEDDIMKTTYGNILKSNSTRLNLFANVNLGRSSRIYVNGSVSYNYLRSKELDYSNKYWSYNLMLGAQQTIFWDLRLSENLIMTPKTYTLQGWTSGVKVGVISVTKTFLNDRLSVSVAGVSHLGTGKDMKYKMVSEGRGFSSYTNVKVPVRQAMLSVSWSFGKSGIKVKKADRTIQNDDVMEKKENGAASGKIGM